MTKIRRCLMNQYRLVFVDEPRRQEADASWYQDDNNVVVHCNRDEGNQDGSCAVEVDVNHRRPMEVQVASSLDVTELRR